MTVLVGNTPDHSPHHMRGRTLMPTHHIQAQHSRPLPEASPILLLQYVSARAHPRTFLSTLLALKRATMRPCPSRRVLAAAF